MGFAGGGGLTGGWGGGTVGGCWTGGAVVNVVVAGVTEGFRVVKGVTVLCEGNFRGSKIL